MQTPYTEEQKQGFKAQYKQRRTRQMILAVPLVAVFIGLRWMRDGNEVALAGVPNSVIIGAVLAVVVGGIAFSIWNWRCPACNRYLGRSISPRFCEKCGVELAA